MEEQKNENIDWLTEELKWLKHMHRHHWRLQDYYQKNRLKFLEMARKYRENNYEKAKLCNKNSYKKHIITRKKMSRLYYLKNRKIKLQKRKEYRENNPEKVKLSKKLSLQKHIKKYNKYRKNKYHNDINFKIATNIRNRINNALKSKKIPKSKKYKIDYEKIISYLKSTLPKDFNKTKYHIDHIIPCCSFNLINEKEFNKCFAVENHRWLTAEENLKKIPYDKKLKLNFMEVKQNG